jgi:protein SCO1/2
MKKALLISGLGLMVLLIASAFSFAIIKPIKVLPRIRLAPAFSLINENGEVVTNESLRGKLVLYQFTYSGCQQTCQSADQTMQEIQKNLSEMKLESVPVEMVTISVDSGDSPEILKARAQSLNADPERWKFVSGRDQERLKWVVGGGFEVYYKKEPDGSIRMFPAFALVDGWGIIRGEYQYQTELPDTERILRHIKVLADEVEKSKGANRLVYEAALLFLCYSP